MKVVRGLSLQAVLNQKDQKPFMQGVGLVKFQKLLLLEGTRDLSLLMNMNSLNSPEVGGMGGVGVDHLKIRVWLIMENSIPLVRVDQKYLN